MSGQTPLKAANSRAFLISGRAMPQNTPEYAYRYRATGLSQGFGDSTTIEDPDPSNYGAFTEVDEITGANERPAVSLEGHYAQNMISKMLSMARKKCAFDLQLHLGACKDPRDGDAGWDKIVVLEKSRITNWSSEDIGALQSADNAVVNETADVSAKTLYELLHVGYGVKAGSIVTNEVVDVTICDTAACGECGDESDGCQKIFAITKAAGGSPSTPADIIFSIDKGVTWYAHDIDSMNVAHNPNAVDCLGSYIVVACNQSGGLHYALKSEFDGFTDPLFTLITTGFVAGGAPNGLFSIDGLLWVVGNGGYVYKTENVIDGVTVVDAGSATAANLQKVHALSRDYAVAVGNNGVVIYTTNGSTWSISPSSPVGLAVDLTAVWMKSESTWIVGTSTGRIYYTTNSGQTWTEKPFPGSGAGKVWDIFFSTDTEGWMAHATAGNSGRIFRSTNGGNTWVLTPEDNTILPLNDRIDALAGCFVDPNFIVGVGLADDGADGVVIVGQNATE